MVEHSAGERTYHIFYQLCGGASAEQRRELQLLAAPDFRYVARSAQMKVAGINDVDDWRDTCHAMRAFKLAPEEQQVRTLTACPHLSQRCPTTALVL